MKYDTVIFSSASGGGGGPTPPHLPVSLKWSAGSWLFDEGWSKYISSSRADGLRWRYLIMTISECISFPRSFEVNQHATEQCNLLLYMFCSPSPCTMSLRSTVMDLKGTDGVRTRDLRFTRPTPYHLATAPALWRRSFLLLFLLTQITVASLKLHKSPEDPRTTNSI